VGLPFRGEIYGATVNATSGDLTEIPGLPIQLGFSLGTPVFNSAGTVLYLPYWMIGSPSQGFVAAYPVNATTGVLGATLGSFPTNGNNPNDASLDTSGKFLLVTNVQSGTIAAYLIETSGTLTAVAGSPFATGGDGGALFKVTSITLHPSKNFVYATNQNSNGNAAGAASTIAGFTIDATTGVLTPIPGTPFPTGGTGANFARVDPTGKFLYIVNRDNDNVAGFAIDQTSGALTAIPGSPFQTGDLPIAVTMDPSGRYLYISNTNSGTIASYAINSANGVLTLVNTLATGTSPSIAEVVGRQ
jgi:6-phosphogluconolactonase (cycloisomerase 2 family)